MDSMQRIRGRAHARRVGAYLGERLGKTLCFVQDDQTVANAPGATVRADINNNLQALVTNSQGATAPATTWRNQTWHDTTANVVKQRNAANSGWLVKATLDETFVIARSSNTILGVSDVGKAFVATGTFTQTLTAAATLGDGWCVDYRNDGTGVITLDPNASETINGATTFALGPGESCRIWCNGSNFKLVGLSLSALLAISGATVTTPADTTEDTLATITVPAGRVTANGGLRITTHWLLGGGAGNKTMRVRGAGANLVAIVSAVQNYHTIVTEVMNLNTLGSQVAKSFYWSAAGTNVLSADIGSTVVDFSAAVSLTITGQKATAGESLQLLHYRVEVIGNGT